MQLVSRRPSKYSEEVLAVEDSGLDLAYLGWTWWVLSGVFALEGGCEKHAGTAVSSAVDLCGDVAPAWVPLKAP